MLDSIFWREVIGGEDWRQRFPIYDKDPDATTWLYIPRTNSIEGIPPYNTNPHKHETRETVYDPENAKTSKYSNRVVVPLIQDTKLDVDDIIFQIITKSAKETRQIQETSLSLYDLVTKAKDTLEMNDLRLDTIVSKHKLPSMHDVKFIDYYKIPERHFYAVCEPENLGRIPMKEDKIGVYLFNPRGVILMKFIGDMYDISMIMES
jgi:hypothetical protein